ncbi:MAG: HEAT repeat domain-containing protein [Candidatus Brocadiia bacterium]
MKTLVFSLAVLGVIVFSSWEYAPAPCCPPPPITTSSLRGLPLSKSLPLESPSMPPQPDLAPSGCYHPKSPFDVAIATSYYAWEDWWQANNVYLLEVLLTDDKSYLAALDPRKDVPRLLLMSSYSGMLEKGIQAIAFEALRGMGEPAADVIISIIDKQYVFDKDTKNIRLSIEQYEEAAIRALGYIGNPRAEEVLTRMLKDESMNKRFWACCSLGRLGNPANIPALENSLATDSDKFVRAAAAEAIARIGGATAIASLRRGVAPNKDCYLARAYIAASLGLLASADPVEEMRVACASEDANIRAAAAISLAHAIRKKLDLGKDYGQLLAEFIANLDREADADVRVSMALAAQIMCVSSEFFAPFRKYLSDNRDPGVRAAFALAYGFTGDSSALPYLTSLPVDADPVVESARASALACIASSDKAKIAADLTASLSPVLAALGILKVSEFLGEGGFDALQGLLSSGEPLISRACAYAFGVNLGVKGLAQTRKYLRGPDAAARAVAFIALGIRGDAAAIGELTNWPNTEDKELRKAVDLGIAMMSMPFADYFKVSLSDAPLQVRCAAVVALGQLNRPELIGPILGMIEKDLSYRVRGYACAALANVKVPPADVERVVNVLITAATTDRECFVRMYAALALSKFKENRPAYDALRRTLGDETTDAAAMAAFSIGLLGNPEATRDIKALLQRGRGTPISCAARIALGLLGDESNAADSMAEFKDLYQTPDMESSAFAIAWSTPGKTYTDMLQHVDNPDFYVREYGIKCFGMMRNLTDEARGKIISKLAEREADVDGTIRFLAAVVRFSMGDRKALKVALSAIYAKDFMFCRSTVVDHEYTMYIAELTELVNDAMPPMYRMKPYFWGDSADE